MEITYQSRTLRIVKGNIPDFRRGRKRYHRPHGNQQSARRTRFRQTQPQRHPHRHRPQVNQQEAYLRIVCWCRMLVYRLNQDQRRYPPYFQPLRQGTNRRDRVRADETHRQGNRRVLDRWRLTGPHACSLHQPQNHLQRVHLIRWVLPGDLHILRQTRAPKRSVILCDFIMHLFLQFMIVWAWKSQDFCAIAKIFIQK